MSNTNTEVLTTAYEKLQGAITQANTVLPELEEAVEKGNLDNYATVSQLEDIAKDTDIKISERAKVKYVDEQIAKAQLEGSSIDTSNFAMKQDIPSYVNIFNKDTAHISGGQLSQTIGSVYGTGIIENSEFFYSELIPIQTGNEYKIIPFIRDSTIFPTVYVLAYNSNKELTSVTSGLLPIYTATATDKYIAIMSKNTIVTTLMCVFDTFPTEYVKYGIYKENIINTQNAKKVNIINKNSIFENYKLVTNPSSPFQFITVDDINTTCVYKKENNKISIFNNRINTSYISKWNSTLTSNTEISIAPNTKVTIDLTDCEYIQFYGKTGFENTLVAVWGDVQIDRYIDTSEMYLNLKELNDLKSGVLKTKLDGKKIVFDGDSITAGAGVTDISSGISPDDNKGWGYNIQQLYPKSICYGYAQSGWRVGRFSSTDTQSLTDHVSQYPSEVDYFVLSGGYNDMAQQMALGELVKPADGNNAHYGTTFDEYTFIGALESWIKQIRIKYPKAKILYVLTPRRVYATSPIFDSDSKGNIVKNVLYSTGYERQDIFWDAIISVCKKWSIPYIDFRYEGQIVASAETGSTVDSVYFNTDIGDVTHPNSYFYEHFLAPRIEAKLIQL